MTSADVDQYDTYDDVHVDVSVDVSMVTSAEALSLLVGYSTDLPVNIYNCKIQII